MLLHQLCRLAYRRLGRSENDHFRHRVLYTLTQTNPLARIFGFVGPVIIGVLRMC